MSKDRLLSDEELGNAIIKRFVNVADIHKQRELFEFINTQKRLHAESVIGRDEDHSLKCKTWQKANQNTRVCMCNARPRNNLRAFMREKV